MKIFLVLVLSSLNFIALAQKTTAYYDSHWKLCKAEDAYYYSEVQKTDSEWLRNDFLLSERKLQRQALYEDEACKIENGYCYYYHANGNPHKIERRVHGKKEGVCLVFHPNGMMADSALFHNGQVVDKRFRWHRNGYLSDSITRINDTTEIQVGWYDDGTPAYAGYLVNGKENGKWQYFYHSGQRSSLETYEKGKRVLAVYFDETGQTLTDTSSVNREASFKGGIEAWKKYLEKRLYWPPNVKFSTPTTVIVWIDFIIDENGKVIDAYVSPPFQPEFDKIALKIVTDSPLWVPAIAHNRNVKAYRRQSFTFAVSN